MRGLPLALPSCTTSSSIMRAASRSGTRSEPAPISDMSEKTVEPLELPFLSSMTGRVVDVGRLLLLLLLLLPVVLSSSPRSWITVNC